MSVIDDLPNAEVHSAACDCLKPVPVPPHCTAKEWDWDLEGHRWSRQLRAFEESGVFVTGNQYADGWVEWKLEVDLNNQNKDAPHHRRAILGFPCYPPSHVVAGAETLIKDLTAALELYKELRAWEPPNK